MLLHRGSHTDFEADLVLLESVGSAQWLGHVDVVLSERFYEAVEFLDEDTRRSRLSG